MADTRGPAVARAKVSTRRWCFGGAVLDEGTLELLVDGRPAPLEPKPLEALLHLLHHAGEVVTKEELQEAVWPGRFLSESVLTNCFSKIRDALGDDRQTIIKTVHGYGYRLVAPVSVEARPLLPPPRFDFQPGDSPPLRPTWKLSARLGSGGRGEVWLAHHAKTHEPRIYKFALDGQALSSLKREITLHRLLRETLPARDDYARVIDWNLTELPCFIESEYVKGGSLIAWAESQGGLDKVPQQIRIELLARVADALSAAHSVGVLHKDLKPANILVIPGGEVPAIKLADFGSGSVIDPGTLEALNITRLGFTQTVQTTDDTSGTLLYLAPEVIGGQPSTVRSDVYAMGVMLYQLLVGDFRKPLAPGWEKEIDDDLLREDIAEAAEGNPANRLGDAALLARRLRSLQARRTQRDEAEAARSRAERQQRDYERYRARLPWTAGGTALIVLALVAAWFIWLDVALAYNFMLDFIDDLATAAESRGHLDEAERMNRGSLAIQQRKRYRILDSDWAEHNENRSMRRLAGVLEMRGQAAEAEQLYRELLARTSGEAGIRHWVLTSDYGNFLADAGRRQEARDVLQRAQLGISQALAEALDPDMRTKIESRLKTNSERLRKVDESITPGPGLGHPSTSPRTTTPG